MQLNEACDKAGSRRESARVPLGVCYLNERGEGCALGDALSKGYPYAFEASHRTLVSRLLEGMHGDGCTVGDALTYGYNLP